MDHVEIAGLRIAYNRAGQGPPLLLLHGGFGHDRRAWRWQLEGLSDEFTVVAWDAPGCGRSSDPSETFRSVDYADCLAAFVDALGTGRPHVCGLSFGGALALELYRQHPTVPRTLILASAYAGWAGSLPPGVVEQRLRRSLADADLPADQWVRGYIPGLLTEAASPELAGEVVGMMSDFHPVGMRTLTRAFGEADLRDVLPHIDVPTLLLYGDADQRSPLSVAEHLHAKIPGSRLVIMPAVGHMSNAEVPERFNAEVRSFLRSAQS